MVSAGEILLLLVSGVAAATLWGGWYAWTVGVVARRSVADGAGARVAALLAPLAGAAAIVAVLATSSSSDVRSSPFWTGFYAVVGLAWIGAAVRGLALAGLDARGDVLERANPAAAVAWTGAVLALAAAFAGANVGDGPGWWVVLFCAALATWPVLALAAALGLWARAAEAITVDRDVSAAFRFGALLLAAGLVLGRSVAGDWGGADAALRDHLRIAAPLLPAAAAAAALERGLARRGGARGGWLAGVGYVAGAAAWVAALGVPR